MSSPMSTCLQYAKKQNKHDLFANFVEACFLLDQ